MKVRSGLALFLFIVVSMISGQAFAEETEKYYIVQLESEINLFDDCSLVGESSLIVMNGEEFAECYNAGIVNWYEEDFEVQLFDETLTDEELYDKWDLEMIQAGTAASSGCTGSDVRIGVIDSGIISHPDLGDNILSGYNYLDNSGDVTDTIGHGTFVSGLIGAKADGVGIDGVAPDAEIVPLKCFDTGYTTRVSHICSALYDAANNYNCDIINMSLGVSNYSKTLNNAIDYVLGKGIIVVAAVGNTGDETLYYPAAFESVVGVASVDSEGERSLFSQKNESVMIAAPGEYIYSTNISGGYSAKKGTSFSTPLVSGCIAAFLNIDEELNIQKLTEIFSLCSDDKGDDGYDEEYGYGIINCKKIVEYMLGEMKCFVAPIKIDTDQSIVIVYNNTNETLDCIVCVGGYDEHGLMKECEITKVEIESHASEKLQSAITGENIRCFVWEDIVNINILSNCREGTGS